MRKVIGAICILIIGLQILIGVPLAVCCAFFLAVQSGGPGTITVEVQAGTRDSAIVPPAEYSVSEQRSLAPPPNVIPEAAAGIDHPILQSREEHGSPLAGTVLAECVEPADEQQLFVAALEKVATEAVTAEPIPAARSAESLSVTSCEINTTPQLLAHLYAMAEIDEQASEFERADQWRALARELRGNEGL